MIGFGAIEKKRSFPNLAEDSPLHNIFPVQVGLKIKGRRVEEPLE